MREWLCSMTAWKAWNVFDWVKTFLRKSEARRYVESFPRPMWRGARCVSLDKGSIRMARCLHQEAARADLISDPRYDYWLVDCSAPAGWITVAVHWWSCLPPTHGFQSVCQRQKRAPRQICVCLHYKLGIAFACVSHHIAQCRIYTWKHTVLFQIRLKQQEAGDVILKTSAMLTIGLIFGGIGGFRVFFFYWCVYQLTYSTVPKSQAHSKTWC